MVKERQHWPIRWQKGTTVARQQQSINSQDFVILTIPEQQKKLDFSRRVLVSHCSSDKDVYWSDLEHWSALLVRQLLFIAEIISVCICGRRPNASERSSLVVLSFSPVTICGASCRVSASKSLSDTHISPPLPNSLHAEEGFVRKRVTSLGSVNLAA